MDYNKIGEFIAKERKAKNYTQAKLAEKLFVSEKTISKWENGKGVPDTNSLPKMCEIFDISINELLNGERLSSDNYIGKAEEKILEQQKNIETKNKLLTWSINIIWILSCLTMLGTWFMILLMRPTNWSLSLVNTPTWLGMLLACLLFVPVFVGIFFVVKLQQKKALYQCKNCKNKYTPTYTQLFFSTFGLMKCPHCKKATWHKKVKE